MKPQLAGRRSGGMTLIEVLISSAIFAIVTVGAVSFLWTEWRNDAFNRDRAFAFDRAQSILEELRAFAENQENQSASTLDTFDDGTGFSYSLTTLHKPAPDAAEFVVPDAAVSANVATNGVWRFSRRITVRHFPGIDARDVRIVTVRIFLNAGSSAPPGTEMANCSSVIRTVGVETPPTQVYDVYFVAIENVPGWWVYMDTIRPFVEASLADLVGRNPGLKFRAHWITKLGYGRDPEYTPYFNEAQPSTTAIPYAYFYPSTMPSGSASVHYYVAGNVEGRVNVDGLVKHGFDAATNPLPYALADQHNHCMREPEEQALFAARTASGQEDDDEPTWRIFLERLNTNPAQYANAIIVNLHGEMLPLPPLRNYSDAARSPEAKPGVRVVTHPEKLRFTRVVSGTSDDVKLRVYTYRTAPAVLPERLDVPVIVEIKGLNLTANVNSTGSGPDTLTVRRILGGLDLNPVDGSRDAYAAGNSPIVVGRTTSYTAPYPGAQYARVYWSATAYGGVGATVLELYGSPLISPRVSNQGLDTTKRLYGMEYVPCTTESANDFSTDLTTSSVVEKNTARWTVRIPAGVLGSADRRIDVTTRIGNGDGGASAPDSAAFNTGIMWPPSARVAPQNESTTYAWWAASATAVPFTERYQFQGDPRHCPYSDLKSGGSSFPNGYNWYFDDFETSGVNAMSSWPGFDSARIKNDGTVGNDGWNACVEVDVPRFFKMLREGLQRSESLFTTLTGFSYYYVGLGNEIGYDSANGYASSIPVSGQPFGVAGTGFEQSITSDASTFGSGVKYVRSNAAGTYWWEMPWLGELCPDGAYAASWKATVGEDAVTTPGTRMGNLPASTAASGYRRVPREQIAVSLPVGTTFVQAQRRTQEEGSTSMFDIGSSATSTFHHQSQDGTTGAIADGGLEVERDFHFPLPAAAGISRPFRLATNADGGVGEEFAFTTEYPRSSAAIVRTYYNHDSGATGSALLRLSTPGISTPAYIVVSGIDRTTASGSSFISRFAMLAQIHGFLSAGDPTLTSPIPLRPRLTIVSPTEVTQIDNPPQIPVSWHTDWRRWDGQPYTSTFATNFTQWESTLEYVPLYSRDNGATWLHMQDDTPATPGEQPASWLRRADNVGPGDETFVWSTPASRFPAGAYLIRVEAYRVGSRIHYSYHEQQIYVNR